MTYEDLKEEDVNKMRNLNRKNHYCLSCKELESLAKKHQNHRKIGDEYTCLLIEYRLTDINFHTEASLLQRCRYSADDYLWNQSGNGNGCYRSYPYY